MNSRNYIQKLGAFSFILLFSLQAGLGLWFHSTLHQHSTNTVTPGSNKSFAAKQPSAFVSCACLDLLSPAFTVVEAVKVPKPYQVFVFRNVSFTPCIILHALQTFRPLRAPPVSLS